MFVRTLTATSITAVILAFSTAPASATPRVSVREIVDTAAHAGCRWDSRYERPGLFELRKALICPEKDGTIKGGPNPYLVDIGKDEAIAIQLAVPNKMLRGAMEELRARPAFEPVQVPEEAFESETLLEVSPEIAPSPLEPLRQIQ